MQQDVTTVFHLQVGRTEDKGEGDFRLITGGEKKNGHARGAWGRAGKLSGKRTNYFLLMERDELVA